MLLISWHRDRSRALTRLVSEESIAVKPVTDTKIKESLGLVQDDRQEKSRLAEKREMYIRIKSALIHVEFTLQSQHLLWEKEKSLS